MERRHKYTGRVVVRVQQHNERMPSTGTYNYYIGG